MIRLLLLTLLACATVPAVARPLTVMSFNVRLPIDSDGANRWEARRDIAAAAIRRARPDVIGTQELHARQGNELVARLPGYRWFGIDRRGGHADEHMGVLFDERRLTLIRTGQFWLSGTPDVPGSISWGHPYPRMVTLAVFERRSDKRRFRLLNTHLPYRAEDEDARTKGAAAIVAWAARGADANLPTVVTGDFNTGPDSPTYRLLTGTFTDTRTAAARRTGPDGTFHNYTGAADRRIDWILARGFRVLAADTLTDREGPVWASDHFPVVARLSFTRSS